VRNNGGTSFGSGKGMREQMDKLAAPRMSWNDVEIHPRSGIPSSPVHLCYRDPVEAIKSLLDRPALAKHMTYAPERHWRDKEAGKRQYTEIFSGDWAWKAQVFCPQEGYLESSPFVRNHFQSVRL
jgi:Plavaka transposase